jgi:hypothetical protein
MSQTESDTMLDRQALSAWIQAQHLDGDLLQTYCEEFTSHPARLVVIKDFLVKDVAARLSQFLSTEAEYEPEHGLNSVEGPVTGEQWLAAAEDDRFFRYGRLTRIGAEHMLSPNALTYLQFRQIFQGPYLKAFFESVSGLQLGASDDFGSHFMTAGDFLRPHSDDNRNRRLALVIYLSPGWEPQFGGQLYVTDRDGEITQVEADYNSVIAFDVLADSTHFVAPVEPAVGSRARMTIGGWYHRV